MCFRLRVHLPLRRRDGGIAIGFVTSAHLLIAGGDPLQRLALTLGLQRSCAVLDLALGVGEALEALDDVVRHGGRDHDRCEVVAQLRAALPSVEHLIIHRNLGVDETALAALTPFTPWTQALACDEAAAAAFEPVWLPFDHPLWIVYSSGTTGLPKPIVHGHGGTVIVALANKILHNDIGCSYHPNSWGERFHWYSSTGWVMWNAQVAGLLNGVTCVIYDGNPGGSKENPDWGILWRMAA